MIGIVLKYSLQDFWFLLHILNGCGMVAVVRMMEYIVSMQIIFINDQYVAMKAEKFGDKIITQ